MKKIVCRKISKAGRKASVAKWNKMLNLLLKNQTRKNVEALDMLSATDCAYCDERDRNARCNRNDITDGEIVPCYLLVHRACGEFKLQNELRDGEKRPSFWIVEDYISKMMDYHTLSGDNFWVPVAKPTPPPKRLHSNAIRAARHILKTILADINENS